jgi:hypothetical protein
MPQAKSREVSMFLYEALDRIFRGAISAGNTRSENKIGMRRSRVKLKTSGVNPASKSFYGLPGHMDREKSHEEEFELKSV